MMRLNDRNFGLPVFELIIGAFLFVGSQRLATVPLPDSGDESMILQVPYEILNRGLFAWPMYRYLGGNIENVWHSFRPVYYWSMTGFFKIFGWGLLQGRAFNLIAAAMTLAMVFLIGRRMFDWRVALVAVLMLVSDNTFVERSRMVRNEYLAVMFALLAFYLFELAERRKQGWIYVSAGLAAGAGVMTHTNIVYIVGAILLLMLVKRGWRALLSHAPYQFAAGAFVVIAYEVIYDIIDYQNVRLQYHGDRAHFARVSSSGFWQNLLDEPARYRDWFGGTLLFPDVPRTLQHLFQALAVIALLYLVVVCVRRFRREPLAADPRVRVLMVTLFAMVFLALATGRRRKYAIYMVYLTPWLALCVGVLFRDGIDLLHRFKSQTLPASFRLYKAALVTVGLFVVAFGALLVRQQLRLMSEITNPNLASFGELSALLRDIIPNALCPASIERPVIWLAFPESDRCYVSLERRMADNIDIDGKDYALVIATKKNPTYIKDADENYTLLGAIEDTPYGDLRVYYTGVDQRYRSLVPQRYQFFERWRGHVSDTQVAGAREVWSAGPGELRAADRPTDLITDERLTIAPPLRNGSVNLGSLELRPNTAYQIRVDADSPEAGWQLTVVDALTGICARQISIPDQRISRSTDGVFRTFDHSRVKLLAGVLKREPAAPLSVSRISIREVAGLPAEN